MAGSENKLRRWKIELDKDAFFARPSDDGEWCRFEEAQAELALMQDSHEVVRSKRQKKVHEWGVKAFGIEHASSPSKRGLRMLEEACETAQAAGVDLEKAHKLLDYVWSRPVGDPFQEVGGLSVTVLALSSALGIDADEAETTEISRIMSKTPEYFSARNKIKNDAGF